MHEQSMQECLFIIAEAKQNNVTSTSSRMTLKSVLLGNITKTAYLGSVPPNADWLQVCCGARSNPLSMAFLRNRCTVKFLIKLYQLARVGTEWNGYAMRTVWPDGGKAAIDNITNV